MTSLGRNARAIPWIAFHIGAIAVFFSSPSWAFQLSPIELSLNSSGPAAQGTLELQNPDERPAAITFTVFARELDGRGVETRQPSPDLEIIPRQLKLEPGATRTVQVVWKGPNEIQKERAYRVVAEQLPVNFGATLKSQQAPHEPKRSQPKINFLLRYVASLYVTPGGRVADSPTSVEIKDVTYEPAKQVLHLTVVNTSSTHRLLEGLKFYIAENKDSAPLALDPGTTEELRSLNLLAGSQMTLHLHTSTDLKIAPKSVHAHF
jgi:fimbrial chaperone protein